MDSALCVPPLIRTLATNPCSPLPPPTAGLSLCLEWCQSALQDPRCPLAVTASWRDVHTIVPLVCSVVSAKASTSLSSSDCHLLATVLVQAFLAAVPSAASPNRVDPVVATRFFAVDCREVAESELLPDCVVIDTPLHRGVREGFAAGPCLVALFDVSIVLEQDGVGEVAATATAAPGVGTSNDTTCRQLASPTLLSPVPGVATGHTHAHVHEHHDWCYTGGRVAVVICP